MVVSMVDDEGTEFSQAKVDRMLRSLSTLTATGMQEQREEPLLPLCLEEEELPFRDPDDVIPSDLNVALADFSWMEVWLRRVRANADFIRDRVFWETMNGKMRTDN